MSATELIIWPIRSYIAMLIIFIAGFIGLFWIATVTFKFLGETAVEE